MSFTFECLERCLYEGNQNNNYLSTVDLNQSLMKKTITKKDSLPLRGTLCFRTVWDDVDIFFSKLSPCKDMHMLLLPKISIYYLAKSP